LLIFRVDIPGCVEKGKQKEMKSDFCFTEQLLLSVQFSLPSRSLLLSLYFYSKMKYLAVPQLSLSTAE